MIYDNIVYYFEIYILNTGCTNVSSVQMRDPSNGPNWLDNNQYGQRNGKMFYGWTIDLLMISTEFTPPLDINITFSNGNSVSKDGIINTINQNAQYVVAPQTECPTMTPSISPTSIPTIPPTISTNNPTANPSIPPTRYPTNTPTLTPSMEPTTSPSNTPTTPSIPPTEFPTNTPTTVPSISPTLLPSLSPIKSRSMNISSCYTDNEYELFTMNDGDEFIQFIDVNTCGSLSIGGIVFYVTIPDLINQDSYDVSQYFDVSIYAIKDEYQIGIDPGILQFNVIATVGPITEQYIDIRKNERNELYTPIYVSFSDNIIITTIDGAFPAKFQCMSIDEINNPNSFNGKCNHYISIKPINNSNIQLYTCNGYSSLPTYVIRNNTINELGTRDIVYDYGEWCCGSSSNCFNQCTQPNTISFFIDIFSNQIEYWFDNRLNLYNIFSNTFWDEYQYLVWLQGDVFPVKSGLTCYTIPNNEFNIQLKSTNELLGFDATLLSGNNTEVVRLNVTITMSDYMQNTILKYNDTKNNIYERRRLITLETFFNHIVNQTLVNARELPSFPVSSVFAFNTEIIVPEPVISERSNQFLDVFIGENQYIYVIVSVVGIGILLMISGYIVSKVKQTDDFSKLSVLFFSLYTWDIISDIFFVLELYYIHGFNDQLIYSMMIGLSILFVIFPVIKNFYDLLKFQRKWQSSDLHADRYRAWLDHYSNVLFILSFISGSTFGSISLVNSNLFGFRVFSMGLSLRDLREFNLKRLSNVILGENLPQIIIQSTYVFLTGNPNDIVIMSMIASVLSVIIAVLDYYTKRNLLYGDNTKETLFSVKITNKSTKKLRNLGKYQHCTKKLSGEIAKIVTLDRGAVELLPMEKYSDRYYDGLVCYFFITTSTKTPDELYTVIEQSLKPDGGQTLSLFARKVSTAWGINCELLKIYDLKWIKSQTTNTNVQLGNINSLSHNKANNFMKREGFNDHKTTNNLDTIPAMNQNYKSVSAQSPKDAMNETNVDNSPTPPIIAVASTDVDTAAQNIND